MLTGHLNLGKGSILMIGITPEDLAQLKAGNSIPLDGREFGLPHLSIYVMPTAGEEAFRTGVYELIEGAKAQAGIEVFEVQPPGDAAKVPS
jgi:hypothetical protein